MVGARAASENRHVGFGGLWGRQSPGAGARDTRTHHRF